ncbi:MAG: hypothetical protein JOY80_05030 [Candidatus Dormibacteraeota bacterium]|nr:hypothetical protein [Candidatus Dormibacteraeota bacterium]
MTQQPSTPGLTFEANTQFRKAWGFVAHRGRVTIENRQLVIYNHAGERVVSGGVGEVSIDRPWWTLGNGCYATFEGQKFNLTLRSLGASMASEALGGGIASNIMGREATKHFMTALDQARSQSA